MRKKPVIGGWLIDWLQATWSQPPKLHFSSLNKRQVCKRKRMLSSAKTSNESRNFTSPRLFSQSHLLKSGRENLSLSNP